MEDYPDFGGYTNNYDDFERQSILSQNQQMQAAMASNAFMDQEQDNMIMYQLDTDKILERIERFLRGDEIKIDKEGNSFYVIPKDPLKRNFNEYGVAELMRIISMYVTKETFLSYYDEERINEILGDLGDALADFIYCNMHKMGMDTKFKQSKFIMVVLNILHEVESCYRRAIHGNEQNNLRTRSIVTQSNALGGGSANMSRINLQKKKWHALKPSTW